MDTGRLWITGLLLIVAGLLACSGFIVAKKAEAKQLLDKIAPYQGIIGVVLLVWGIYELFWLLTHLKEVGAARSCCPEGHGPKSGKWAVNLAGWLAYFTGILEILLGFLLGFGLIASKAGSKSPDMAAKGEAMQRKLIGIQVPLGAAGALLGLLWIVVALSVPTR